ncbi:MAG TPA: hypothetical protein VF594_01900 [Rubricoccaceae bacterium]
MLRLAALLVLVSGCVLASGCVHSRPATLDTDAGRADLNARTAGRVATLHLHDGPRAIRDLHIGPDETTWTDRLSGAPGSAPTADIAAVSLRRGRVWRSLLIGAGVGAALGVVAAATDEPSGFVQFTPAFYIGTFGLNGALIGAGVGAGQSDRFVVRPDAGLSVRLDSLGGR